jgi:hypothetical protein
MGSHWPASVPICWFPMVVETAIHHVNSAAAVGLGKATLAAFQWHLELILET